MSAAHVAALVMVVAGTAIIVAACLAALVAADSYRRLHYATSISSLGGPLIAVGLAVDSGANLTTASILLPMALLFFSSPILSAAVAKTIGLREERIEAGSPE